MSINFMCACVHVLIADKYGGDCWWRYSCDGCEDGHLSCSQLWGSKLLGWSGDIVYFVLFLMLSFLCKIVFSHNKSLVAKADDAADEEAGSSPHLHRTPWFWLTVALLCATIQVKVLCVYFLTIPKPQIQQGWLRTYFNCITVFLPIFFFK